RCRGYSACARHWSHGLVGVAASPRACARVGGRRVLHRRPRSGDAHEPARAGRVEPARRARAAQALAREGAARRAGLRDAGGREGRRRARALSSPAVETRAVGAARQAGRRRPRGARDSADARGRRPHSDVTAKLPAYAGVAALGLLAALATRRPELAVIAAPFALYAGLGLLLARPPRLDAEVELEAERALEGDELEVRVTLVAEIGADRVEVLLELPRELVVADG